MLRKAGKIVNISTVVADKGYDGEENIHFTESELHARAVISPENRDKPPGDKTRRQAKKTS